MTDADIKRRFAAAWLCSFDLTTASKAVGIDILRGTDLLADPDVKKMVTDGRQLLNDHVLISAAHTLDSLRKIAVADLSVVLSAIGASDGKTIPEKLAGLPDVERYALKSVQPTKTGLKIEMHSKTEALSMIGKALGIWSDAVATVNVNSTQPESEHGIFANLSTQEKAERYAAMVDGPTQH